MMLLAATVEDVSSNRASGLGDEITPTSSRLFKNRLMISLTYGTCLLLTGDGCRAPRPRCNFSRDVIIMSVSIARPLLDFEATFSRPE